MGAVRSSSSPTTPGSPLPMRATMSPRSIRRLRPGRNIIPLVSSRHGWQSHVITLKWKNGVLQAQRRILASLRNRTFFSLVELNEAIREEVKKLNERPMTGIGKSRHDLFVEIDKPALHPLPEERYVITSWKKARVHI